MYLARTAPEAADQSFPLLLARALRAASTASSTSSEVAAGISPGTEKNQQSSNKIEIKKVLKVITEANIKRYSNRANIKRYSNRTISHALHGRWWSEQQLETNDQSSMHLTDTEQMGDRPITSSVVGLTVGIRFFRTGSLHSPSMKSMRLGTAVAILQLTTRSRGRPKRLAFWEKQSEVRWRGETDEHREWMLTGGLTRWRAFLISNLIISTVLLRHA